MPVTTAQTRSATPTLGLRLHTTRAPVDRPLSWVHVSELADPTPFLQGGELLLTTGLALRHGEPGRPSTCAGWRRPAWPALGLGTGLSHADRPARSSCRGRGRRGARAPRGAAADPVHRALPRRLGGAGRRRLRRGQHGRRPPSRSSPARRCRPAGRPRWSSGWRRQVGRLGAALRRGGDAARGRARGRRRAGLPGCGSSWTGSAGCGRRRAWRCRCRRRRSSLQSLGNGARTRGFLAVGRPGPFPRRGPAHRQRRRRCCSPCAWSSPGPWTARRRRCAARCCGCCSPARSRPSRPVVEALGERTARRTAAGAGPAGQRRAAVGRRRRRRRRRGARPAAAVLRASSTTRWSLLVADDGLADRLTGLPDRVAGRRAIGVSLPVPWARLADGARQARQAAEQSRTRPAAGSPPSPTSPAWGWRALLDPGRHCAPSPRRCSRRWSPPTAPARATSSSRCGSGSPTTASGSPRPRHARRAPAHAAQAHPPGRRAARPRPGLGPASAPSSGWPCTHPPETAQRPRLRHESSGERAVRVRRRPA